MNFEEYKPSDLGGSIHDAEELLAEHLNHISKTFGEFYRIQDIKKSFAEKLTNIALDESDFDDLEFGTMQKLESLSSDLTVEEFLRDGCVGCEQTMLCLQSVKALTNTSKDLKDLETYIGEAIGKIEYVLTQRGSPTPSYKSEYLDYQRNTLAHLTALTDLELQGMPNYEQLKTHLNLIKDFKLVCEIHDGLEVLVNEFGELKQKQGRDSPHLNGVSVLVQLAEIEEMTDLSGVI